MSRNLRCEASRILRLVSSDNLRPLRLADILARASGVAFRPTIFWRWAVERTLPLLRFPVSAVFLRRSGSCF